MKPNVLILRAPGTNCDGETAYAFERAGAEPHVVHVNRVLENPKLLADAQILCLPGGFSYGDDIAAGRILGNQMRRYLADTLQEFKSAGKLVLGICNGFQIMIKAGLFLDTDSATGPGATLTWNESGKFEDRWVHLSTRGNKCVFLDGIKSMYLPIAHAEGRFVTRDDNMLGELEENGQLVLRYCSSKEECEAPLYPENPNGSMSHVAGICDRSGRIFGLMPHPERHIDPTHHPRWTRQPRHSLPAAGEGLRIFQNAVAYFG